VTHVGAASDGDEAAARRVGEGIVSAFEIGGEAARSTRLLLENTAGAGHTFGGSFEQLADVIRRTGMGADLLGVCFDTCHGFAFGYPLGTAQGWEESVASFDEIVGLDRLGLIHANDCMFERGSHRDRHAWIGDGFVGTTGFEAMVCVSELADVCAVTEMPGEVPIKDSENLSRLSELRSRCSSQ
jgi:deoxyribonuclease-4